MENNICMDIINRCGGNAQISVCGKGNSGKSQFIGQINALINADEQIASNAKNLVFNEVNGETQTSIANSNACIYITTDGSFERRESAEIAQQDEGDITKIKNSGKPFVIVLNVADVTAESVQTLKNQLQQKYGSSIIVANCANLQGGTGLEILRQLLFNFPVTNVDVNIPEWVSVMPVDSSAISELIERIRATSQKIVTLSDCEYFDGMLSDATYWQSTVDVNISPADGNVQVTAKLKDGILYEMLTEISGEQITDESSLMSFVSSSSQAKRGYDKVKDALECAKVNGYGIVCPDEGDLVLNNPTVVKQGNNIGIKLNGSAASYHIIKVDVNSEVNPIMGTVATSEGMVNGIMSGFEADPQGMWDTNLFGKSLRGMVSEGLNGKVTCLTDDTRTKLRRAITRMVNESKGSVICILL